MNFQELHPKLLEEFKHLRWPESCKGSCQGKRELHKSSDSSSCLEAGSPQVPILRSNSRGVLSWQGRLFGWDFGASSWLSSSDTSRRMQLCSTVIYSNSHLALWIFFIFFLHCQDLCVKWRCCKAWPDQLHKRELAQPTAVLHKAVASHALLTCTEIKIPPKLVVLATLLREDWKVQHIIKTAKD